MTNESQLEHLLLFQETQHGLKRESKTVAARDINAWNAIADAMGMFSSLSIIESKVIEIGIRGYSLHSDLSLDFWYLIFSTQLFL